MIKFQKLSDVAELTVGYVGTMGKEYSSQGVLFLRSLNIKPFGFDLSDIKYIPDEFHRKLNKSALHTNDVVIVRTGIPGTCAVIPPELDGCNCADLVIVRPNQEVIDPYFLCAFINSWGRTQVSNVKVGAVQKHFNVTSAEEMLIPVIDIQAQRSISDLLYNINSLIDNNTTICADLEAMAKLLYDYWFVQFDFPDKNGKPYKSSGGKMVWNEDLKREIPEGWEVKPLGDICECLLGGTPSRDKPEYWNGDINWINSGSVNGFRISEPSETITQKGLDNTSTYLMPRNTTVLAITGATLGQVSILNIDTCANQSVVGVLANRQIPTEYIYPFIVSSMKVLMRNQTGGAQQHINKDDVKSMLMLIPSQFVMDEYIHRTKPLYDLILGRCSENVQFASLRDFLLPMLMNGQVKVGGKGDLPPMAYPTDAALEDYLVAAEPQKGYDAEG